MFSKQEKVFAGLVLVVLAWQALDLPAVVSMEEKIKARLLHNPGHVSGLLQIRLPVQFHKQEHSLSCEIATLKMALQAHGLNIPESELIGHLVFDPTPKSSGVWGDPSKGFVGDIDGRMPQNGYGVYWDPIAQVGKKYTRTETFQNGTAQEVAQHVKEGNPVIWWGHVGRGNRLTWKTPEGKIIEAVNGEHTRVVVGFEGTVQDPVGFFVIDPRYGEQYWKTEDFMKNWSAFSHSGVVVYGHPKWVKTPLDSQIWEISNDGTTRQPLNLTIQEFFSQGGPEAVVTITEEQLEQYSTGATQTQFE